ncbi:hypothetical protein H2200_008072 [Cladophialophora chaetospira]|uniref:Uncharacterized protein n=1 Tax=Cladophialophora chaetospira TaxID=386627 RepID=A0AA39CH72_9EURO|nr:hypothetical protein H2200_008072 [Cladophialophora chaetospira]
MAQQQPPATTLGKRKKGSDDNDIGSDDSTSTKTFLLRAIFDNKVTTATTAIDASQFSKLNDLTSHIRTRLLPSALSDDALSALKLSPQLLLLLQETSTSKANKSTIFIVVTANDYQQYRNWYQRNLVDSELQELKIEVHVLQADETGYEERVNEMREYGKDGGQPQSALRQEYRQIAKFTKRGIMDKGTWRAYKPQDIGAEVVKACIEAGSSLLDESTEEYFPVRDEQAVKSGNGKHKNSRRAPKRPKGDATAAIVDDDVETAGEGVATEDAAESNDDEMDIDSEEDVDEDEGGEDVGAGSSTGLNDTIEAVQSEESDGSSEIANTVGQKLVVADRTKTTGEDAAEDSNM